MSLRLGLKEITPYINSIEKIIIEDRSFSTIDDLINKTDELTTTNNTFVSLPNGSLGYVVGIISGISGNNWIYVKSFTTDNIVNCNILNDLNLSFKVGDIVVLNPYKDDVTVAKGTSYGYGMKNAELIYVGEMEETDNIPEFKSITEWSEYALSLDKGTISADSYITFGKVTKINTAWSDQYGNITITISDGTNSIQCYRASGTLGANIKVDDYVLIYGQVQNYNNKAQSSTPEIKLLVPGEEVEIPAGNELKSIDEMYNDVFVNLENFTKSDVEYYSYGRVDKIKTAYQESYQRITVSFTTSDGINIDAYRLTGPEGANIEVGDSVLLKGYAQKTNAGACRFYTGCTLIKVFKANAEIPEVSRTIVPTRYGTTVTENNFTVTIDPEPDLIRDNIRSGVQIYGVTGTLEPKEQGQSLLVDICNNISTSLTKEDLEGAFAIRPYMFYYGPVNSVELPDTVVEIGEWSFHNCSGLQSITLPLNLNTIKNSAFYGCRNLPTIMIPQSVVKIEPNAFRSCPNLTIYCEAPSQPSTWDAQWNIDNLPVVWAVSSFPITLNNIKYNISTSSLNAIAFDTTEGFSALNEVQIVNQIENDGTVYPVVSLSLGLLSSNTVMTKLTIPFVGGREDSINESGHFGFIFGATTASSNNSYVPSSLKHVVVTNENHIPDNAFYECEHLTTIELPDSCSSLGQFSFQKCRSLTNIVLPSNLHQIYNGAFWSCESLTSITIPSNITYIGENAFRYCPSLSEVIFEDGIQITSIEASTFNDCDSLTEINIPPMVQHIDALAFGNCGNLSNVSFPYGLTTIGNSAFYYCSSITEITLPNTLVSIDPAAFQYCRGLASIIFSGTIEQWNAVQKGSDWAFGIEATYVQCTDGTVEI